MNFPALAKLGINRPHEISSYTVSSLNGVDTLRIKYTRQKGALLPMTKRFQFPRRPYPCPNTNEQLSEISPALEAAITELEELLDKDGSNENKTVEERKAALIEELNDFESFVQTRLAEFKAEINKL